MIFVVLVLLVMAMVWFEVSLKKWLIASAGILIATAITGITGIILSLIVALGLAGMALLLYFLPGVRKQLLTSRVFTRIKRVMPKISDTEREAIDAGTVWWDAQLFSGKPQWQILHSSGICTLSDQEQAFMDGPVNTVCHMVDDWEVTHELNDLPEAVWRYIRDNQFFGLNISPEYGGLGFSAHAQSRIIQKLSTRSSTLAVTVMVPNSLGPAELILHHGTDQQKAYYLPRLSAGEEIPCFGLTNPWAGSDAAGMPDAGIVCRQKVKGKMVTGFRVNWEKRYITLGPVATLLGLAFRAYDPDHLLGDEQDLGITCALVPTSTKGIHIGDRHLPLNASFQNGPNSGADVFVPLDWVIGGKEMVGSGWRMLMESLAAGRGISLPAAAAGTAKLAMRTCGAYARVREQFGISIGRFEGVEEVLARIGGLTYLLDSGRYLLTAALDAGERPAVLSAIVKQQCTELSRQVINDAMDLHGGKGICMGPGNYLARVYQQIPIGITVEGANILTRSLIIFGQGSMRCHPLLLKEIEAINNDDPVQGMEDFDELLVTHIEHLAANMMRSFTFSLTRGRLSKASGDGFVRAHTSSVNHLSASFAWLADVVLLLLGGDLKRREMLSGRFADVLSNLFLVSAVINRYRHSNHSEDEAALADWACRYGLYQAQQAMDGILRNFPLPLFGKLLRLSVFTGGRYLQLPDDALSKKVANLLQTPGPLRDSLTEDVFIPDNEADVINQLEKAFRNMVELSPVYKRLRKSAVLPDSAEDYEHWLQKLMEVQEITADESGMLQENRELLRKVIDVDSFDGNNEPVKH